MVASIPSTPNFALLIALIGHLSENIQTTAIPLQNLREEKIMSPEKLQEAIRLIKTGEKETGKNLLLEIVRSDPQNEAAWLWLVSVVPPENRIFCLEKALSINPNNPKAKQYLGKLKADQQSEQSKSKSGSSLKPGGNTDARLSGLFLFLLGAGAGYWQIILPIMKAFQQEPYVSYSTEIVVISSIAIFFGLFLIVFGSKGLGILMKPSKLNMILLLIATLIFGFGCYFGMEFIMNSLGYY